MENLDFQIIGKRIREIRLSKKLTQENLADAVDVNTSHISNVENGKVKISLTTLVSVCNALNVTLDYLLYNDYQGTSNPLDNELLKNFHNHTDEMKEKIIKIVEIL